MVDAALEPPEGEAEPPQAHDVPEVGEHTSELHHPEGVHAVAEAHVDTDEARVEPEPEAAAPPVPAAEHLAVVGERDSYLDQLQRCRADYDNLNKRRLREVAEAGDRGAAAIVRQLLDVLDTFGFALQAAASSSDPQLAKGVELVHDKLLQVLSQAGLEEVPGVGTTFDPQHHEALMSEQDGGERDEPEIAEVLRTGYRFKSQLLRPASVRVVH